MTVEKVQLNVTLSGGECVWQKGTVLSSPLPPAILKEIELNTGTVEVLETSDNVEIISNEKFVTELTLDESIVTLVGAIEISCGPPTATL